MSLAALDAVAASVRAASGIVTDLVEGVAKAAQLGTAGYDAVKARRLQSRLLDIRAAVTRFSTNMNAAVRRDLVAYLREWTETAALHSRSDMLPPAERAAAFERAFAANRKRGLGVPSVPAHDAQLDATWAMLCATMKRAASAAGEIVAELEEERSEAILDETWIALIRAFRARLAIYDDLAALPPPVTRAEIARLASVTEAYAALIAELDAANARLAELIRDTK